MVDGILTINKWNEGFSLESSIHSSIQNKDFQVLKLTNAGDYIEWNGMRITSKFWIRQIFKSSEATFELFMKDKINEYMDFNKIYFENLEIKGSWYMRSLWGSLKSTNDHISG